MSTVHITNGDVAAESLRSALRLAERDDAVVALRDDLAVGPIRHCDDMPESRADFWQDVLSGTTRYIERELRDEAAQLARLVSDNSHIVLWHADSTGDQLTLRRVCYHLRNQPQRLNEVRLSIRDLTDPDAWAHKRGDRATSLGMFAPPLLRAHLPDAAPISVLRISRLALEWQEAKHANGETRRWHANQFTSGTFADLDALILDHADETWQPANRVAADVMLADIGFLVSDSIVLWRMRQLAAGGRLRLRGNTDVWASIEICAVPRGNARPAR